MEKQKLVLMKPTAQVRALTEEVLRDGEVHSRSEVVAYIKKTAEQYHLPPFREGHIAGGIREALTNLECEMLGRGTFQAKKGKDTDMGKKTVSLGEAAAEVCENAKEQLIRLSREIDYVSASEKELEFLSCLRNCVKLLEEYQGSLGMF